MVIFNACLLNITFIDTYKLQRYNPSLIEKISNNNKVVRHKMEFNVSQLLKEGIGSRRSYDLDETIEPMSETGTTHVLGSMVLTRTNSGVWATGKLKANAVGSCIRCLALTMYSVSFALDAEYTPATSIASGSSIDLTENHPDAFSLTSEHILDLSEPIRQCVIIEEPMKLLCNSECSGLCPGCGVNLNQEPCDCKESIDPRWRELKNFTPQQKQTDK